MSYFCRRLIVRRQRFKPGTAGCEAQALPLFYAFSSFALILNFAFTLMPKATTCNSLVVIVLQQQVIDRIIFQKEMLIDNAKPKLDLLCHNSQLMAFRLKNISFNT